MQDDSAVCPVVFPYLPAPQSVQLPLPDAGLYLPATHVVHVPPSGPVNPALQIQLVKAALPAGELEFDGQALHVELAEDPTAVEYVPSAQSVHTADPVEVLNFPVKHAVHVPPSGPDEPVLQVQLVKAALPAGELEFDGQVMHVAAPPAAEEYFPAPQSVHAEDPVEDVYFPASQDTQGPPLGPDDPMLQMQENPK